ncbi:hypothetical protein EJB05_38213, partial [Eragrostis curvula]
MEQARVVEKKPKVVFVLGATATGKSKLAIALAKRFDGEVINADKIQLHAGAPIITNKVTEEEQDGVRHHLLGVLPPDADFTAEDFRREAAAAVSRVVAAGRLPVVAGGSNTYIEALVEGDGAAFRAAHDVLFLWIDSAPALLAWYTAERVDDMVARGLVDEARASFDAGAGADYSRGVRRAIGLPEMHAYLAAERGGAPARRSSRRCWRAPCARSRTTPSPWSARSKLDGWDVRRVDATALFARMAKAGGACDQQTWEALVWEPCEKMVRRFLETPVAPIAVYGNGTSSAAAGGDGEPTVPASGGHCD